VIEPFQNTPSHMRQHTSSPFSQQQDRSGTPQFDTFHPDENVSRETFAPNDPGKQQFLGLHNRYSVNTGMVVGGGECHVGDGDRYGEETRYFEPQIKLLNQPRRSTPHFLPVGRGGTDSFSEHDDRLTYSMAENSWAVNDKVTKRRNGQCSPNKHGVGFKFTLDNFLSKSAEDDAKIKTSPMRVEDLREEVSVPNYFFEQNQLDRTGPFDRNNNYSGKTNEQSTHTSSFFPTEQTVTNRAVHKDPLQADFQYYQYDRQHYIPHSNVTDGVVDSDWSLQCYKLKPSKASTSKVIITNRNCFSPIAVHNDVTSSTSQYHSNGYRQQRLLDDELIRARMSPAQTTIKKETNDYFDYLPMTKEFSKTVEAYASPDCRSAGEFHQLNAINALKLMQGWKRLGTMMSDSESVGFNNVYSRIHSPGVGTTFFSPTPVSSPPPPSFHHVLESFPPDGILNMSACQKNELSNSWHFMSRHKSRGSTMRLVKGSSEPMLNPSSSLAYAQNTLSHTKETSNIFSCHICSFIG